MGLSSSAMVERFERNKEKIIKLLWILAVLASVKSIFTDTGFDNSYTVAMSYRHLKGDGMFEYMWEPHQTSIFFTDFFMWIYHIFVPSYTGVMLYLQIVGTLFFAAIGYALYRVLRDITGDFTAQLASMFFIMFRAKQSPFPDFANLHIAFSMLLLLCLVKFTGEQQKKRYLCLAAVFLCLQVLAYPSCVLAYFPAVAILFWKTKDRLKNIGLFTGICVLFGGVYAGYFLMKIGADRLAVNLGNIIYSDSHSGEAVISRWNYFSGLFTAVVWIVLSGGLAWVIQRAAKRFFDKDHDFLAWYGLVLFLSEIVLLFAQRRIGLDWTCTFYILPLLLMALGCMAYREMNEREKIVWVAGNLFAIVSFLSTWLLTDLGLITMAAYMVLGGTVSFVALRHLKAQAELFLLTICMLVVVHRGLVVWGYANKGAVWMVQDVRKIITSGPSLGIVCDYMTCYEIESDREDHAQYITADDSVLFVREWLIDSMEFLLTDAAISNYSTIDTPIYNEKLLDYLELYPEKRPTVVAVSCWFGNMNVKEDTWIMQWVNENYEAVGDGKYWRYYRAK